MLQVTVALLVTGYGWAADFFVAPKGSDANPGTTARPFATLHRAQQAVRAAVAKGLTEDVTVFVLGGRYELTEPLRFGPEDGGTERHSVTWRAIESAIVSGGRPIEGWKSGGDGVLTAELPEVRAGDWYFRELFVNGRRAVRARTPDADAEPNHFRLTGSQQAGDLSAHALTLAPECLGAWSNLPDAEIVVFGEWEITRKRLQAVDPAAGTVTLLPPHVAQHPAIGPRPGMACYFENAPEMLDQRGEWYLDRQTGVLLYLAGNATPPEKLMNVFAPRLTRLMEVTGTADRPVRNLHFEGFQFEHCAWPLPEPGHPGVQGTFHTPPPTWSQGWTPVDAALVWEWAQGCSLTGAALRHLGGAGIRLRQGCRDNVVEGNTIEDVGGNGVMVGEHYPGWDWTKGLPPAEEVASGNRVANNHVTRCGQEYFGAVGVWVGFAEGTLVAHNLIHDLPYTGISVGWQWDPTPTACQGNVVEYNHIFQVMQRLADGGCIYTLGYQPGTVLRGNVLHGSRYSDTALQSAYSNNGIFFDQGSKDFLVEGNLIYDTAGGPIRFNLCEEGWHTWADNHFGLTLPVEGKRGTALQCNGTGLDIPHAPELDPPQLTAEAWIRLEAFPVGGDNRRWIVNKNDDEWTESHWGLVIAGPKVGAYLNIGGGRENSHELLSDEVLTLNRWEHLAMTYDGQDLKIYHNGELVGTLAIGRERVPGGTSLSLGKRQDNYVALTGAIDEVALYDRALSAEEVRSRFAA
ncbi:MAG: hypothetical protein FJX74_22765, partial [Armatimonadetes bacterium]|nr:hypothetical protein [Armatimonadota bacterium]